MSDTTATRMGRSIERLGEDGLDGMARRIWLLCELDGALDGVEMEFEHDDTAEATGLVEEVRALMHTLRRLSLADDAELTLNRECGRCSGDGKTRGEDPCEACEGKGYVHADEAEE